MIFTLYDKNGVAYSDLEMGAASYTVDHLEPESTYEEWLDLKQDTTGNSTGQLKVNFFITAKKKPGYELAILVVGSVITLASLVMGFYFWKMRSKYL